MRYGLDWVSYFLSASHAISIWLQIEMSVSVFMRNFLSRLFHEVDGWDDGMLPSTTILTLEFLTLLIKMANYKIPKPQKCLMKQYSVNFFPNGFYKIDRNGLRLLTHFWLFSDGVCLNSIRLEMAADILQSTQKYAKQSPWISNDDNNYDTGAGTTIFLFETCKLSHWCAIRVLHFKMQRRKVFYDRFFPIPFLYRSCACRLQWNFLVRKKETKNVEKLFICMKWAGDKAAAHWCGERRAQ